MSRRRSWRAPTISIPSPVLPALGQIVAGDRDSYQYLVESIRRFPPQDELAALMRDAGLEQVRWRDFTFGVASLHSGWRL